MVRATAALLLPLLLLGHCAASADWSKEELFRAQVQAAIRQVRAILDRTRQPYYPAEVPHVYDDKFLLVELTTRGAAASIANALEEYRPGWWSEHQGQLAGWAAKGPVTLRFSACERCSHTSSEVKELESNSKQVVERTGMWGLTDTATTKVVTKVEEHLWAFTSEWELALFPGTDPAQRLPLQKERGQYSLRTSGPPGSEVRPPRPETSCPPPLDVDVSWLLRHLQGGVAQFAIDRAAPACRTPRRNPEVEEVLEFAQHLRAWGANVHGYLLQQLFPTQADHAFDLKAITDKDLFSPVLGLFALDTNSSDGVAILAGDMQAVLAEHQRSVHGRFAQLMDVFPEHGSLITLAAAKLGVLGLHLQGLTRDLADAVDALEAMLRKQLLTAVGKEVTSSDFREYMAFHSRRLLQPEYQPRGFSYAIRRPGRSPEGLLSIEADGIGPVQTVVQHKPATVPMRLALDASAELAIMGERSLHALVMHKFAHERPAQHKLLARARQFSSFILLAGKVAAADLFEASAALIIKDKDELSIPLLLDTLPTPKAFRDAITSLSPVQQRFAKAIREMQLSSSVFGICVIQIKPQLERLLNLPQDSLTKEIQLTQDLMTLFIDYQVPSDLLTYDGDEAANSTQKLREVKEHVSALKHTIQGMEGKKVQKGAPFVFNLYADGQGAGEADVEEAERYTADGASQMRYKSKVAPEMVDKAAPLVQPMALRMARHPSPIVDSTPPPTSDAQGEAQAQAQDQTGSGSPQPAAAGGVDAQSVVDYTALPRLLDRRFEELDKDAALRTTKIQLGAEWGKREQQGIRPQEGKQRLLRQEQQGTERNRAFDLLDALSRSGVLPVEHASLHVVLAATHGFDQTLIDTVVRGAADPIEEVERSVLIMASTLLAQPVAALVAKDQLERVCRASPALFGGACNPPEMTV